MITKIAYYPLLDMILAFRQLYSGERFKPFCGAMEVFESKLSPSEKDSIISIGDRTEGWLGVIERFIELSGNGIVSPEELILSAIRRPGILEGRKVPSEITGELAVFIKSMWSSYFNSDAGRYGKNILDKVIGISEAIDAHGLMYFILEISDRMEKCGENSLKVHIKPDHTIRFDDVSSSIIMPSLYASRSLTFWYSGQDYLFYISMTAEESDDIEPSDMLLLRTLAFNDRTRLKMLRLLSGRSYTTNEMAEKLNMNASTVSRHFKVFKDAGFVDIQNQEGNSIFYSLNIREIGNSFKHLFDFIKEE
ncbi:MAG: ArsR/SmtB family transcription factor [Pseudomonadota bacterium]